jgi:hypothetical protein
LQCAVASKRGTTEFNVFNYTNFNSILPPQGSLTRNYEGLELIDKAMVEVYPLDELLVDVPEISILKVDVQGMEADVLDGAREVLKRTRAMLVEVNFLSHYEGDTLFTRLHEKITNECGLVLYNFAGWNRAPNGGIRWADAVYINPAQHR